MPASSAYALIAISNLQRAAAFRQIVSETLRLDTVLVRDGDDALQEMARRGLPALLIVDLSLPRVDGFAVVRRVRRQGSEHTPRVIVVAAHESLLAAARELAGSLAISNILPLDVDPPSLQAALAAERARLRTEASPAASSHSQATPSNEIEGVIDRAAIDARRRFNMPASVGYLRMREQEHVTFHVAAKNADAAPSLGELSDAKFLRQVAESVDPLIIPDVENHPVFAQALSKGPKTIRGFAAVPVTTSREDVRAALCVIDVKPLALSASDLDALTVMGRTVGQDIDRTLTTTPEARAADAAFEDVKALQHLAATDPLTGLANRRGGEKHIASEISRAKREKRPLSCILLDIDRFKQVNDTFGHQAGDQVLRDISALLRRTVRAYDILVRWGGEEFLMVMPGVDLEAARMLAERVRATVETLDTHGIGTITISAGVARFESDYDLGAALKTADQRLYQAKSGGRNMVV
jgi:diguanylate cyclase (GGDEF)-like protein